jgi:CheY-like chemotaxis protein
VSRILVADDNSNIQKMVALALKDEGIDVVAVGNGEAAIRKIPDLRPDLVLADVFMPVRNGYEVCEFVKSDSRYMSTPVVLLVGAFDPLDEQETQRVRADGVLKKPFVPPDPLINMVKARLAKSNGQKPLPATATLPAKPATLAQTMPAPRSQPAPSSEVAAVPAPELPHAPDEIRSSVWEQASTIVIPPKQSESPVPVPEVSDEVVTAARDPNLGEPFWATPVETEEPEEKPETPEEDMLDLHSFGQEESSPERDGGPRFRPDSPLLDLTDFGADTEGTTVLQSKVSIPKETNRPQPAAADQDASNAVTAQSENEAPSASPATLETPPDIFKFDPALTFPSATPEAPIEMGSAEPGGAAFERPSPENSMADDAGIFSWPAATSSTAETRATAEKKPDIDHSLGAPLEPIEPNLPPLPSHDAMITAATEAARLAFAELNTLPGSGGSAEGSTQKVTGIEPKDSISACAAVNARPFASPEMI